MVDTEDNMSALTKWIIGAAMVVHRVPGPGLLESSDEEALCVEFELREIPFDRQANVDGLYRGRTLKGRRLEAIVDYQVGLEIRPALVCVPDVVPAQVLSCLKATGLRRALWINLGMARLGRRDSKIFSVTSVAKKRILR
jgi:GxxExxY protein